MLRYDQIILGEGGPWIGSIPIPGFPPGVFFPKEEIIAGIQCMKKSENLALTGGDPLLHPGIPEIIKAADEIGYRRVLMRTSGHHFVNPKTLSMIVETGILLFEMVLLTDDKRGVISRELEEQYAGMRNIRRRSEWDERLENVFLAIALPVGRDNHGHLIELLEKGFRSFAVDRVVFCWGEPEFPIWEAAAALQEAIDFCRQKGVWAVTRGIPLCVVPERPYHPEVLFHHDGPLIPLSLPLECGPCCFSTICSHLPGTDSNYRWAPRPMDRHRFAPFILDIVENGFVFDETSTLYIPQDGSHD